MNLFRRHIPTKDLSRLGKQTRHMLGASLWMRVLTGLLLGVCMGLYLAEASPWSAEQTESISQWIALPGYLFLAVIQMIVIPLVLSSVFHGIAGSGDVAIVKKVGLRVVFYFIGTTTVAISVGSLLAYLIQPGRYLAGKIPQNIDVQNIPKPSSSGEVSNWALEVTSIIPKNIFDTLAQGDLLRVVIFAAFFGVAALALKREHNRTLVELATAVQEASMVLVGWVMQIAPLAVFGLITQVVSQTGVDALVGMSIYMGTVISGLLVMYALYLILIAVFTEIPVLHFVKSARSLQLLAFSTSSSAAVMPVTMQTAEKQLGVSQSVARLVVPMGATINMDGTALYQAVAALFLAQIFGVPIGLTEFGLIMLTTVGASVGAPGTPGVGIVVLASILIGIGVPAEGIAIILGVDRILDMCRTTLNVSGDLVASALMHRMLGKKLEPEPLTD